MTDRPALRALTEDLRARHAALARMYEEHDDRRFGARESLGYDLIDALPALLDALDAGDREREALAAENRRLAAALDAARVVIIDHLAESYPVLLDQIDAALGGSDAG